MTSSAAIAALPQLLAEVAEVAAEVLGSEAEGFRSAIALARARGGQRVYVSPDVERNAWLTQAVGRRVAEALTDRYGSGEIDIPMGPAGGLAAQARQRRRLIAAGLDAEVPINEIARDAGCTRRRVFQVQQDLGRPRRAGQFDFFETED